jgi:hypothetical protein
MQEVAKNFIIGIFLLRRSKIYKITPVRFPTSPSALRLANSARLRLGW